ncbi:DeoR/GlpR family DNA-binding transcription regulator [Paenibacillus sp. sptzw28]|uniref:DeoR/GlpR family DNA-binding transcription regulator n=1 Tax=Paenibacillus sp. sptzw28 TaxID=715179 RepID=UPI001C6EE2B5|nr:DeoR/GlpR family DNA-binding transcription regulator [Paenibacillus sp. sptzw28]QYR22891.1 DeoR/GlpR family DNA-binding transcription regulator [Paenibacillus sp. sptzw28]
MLAVTRQRKIIDTLQQTGAVKVSELSAMLQVTEKTIRDDLEKLEGKGLLRRTHGGAVPLEPSDENIYPLVYPNNKLEEAKEAIAASAVKQIEAGDIIALDGGSTTLQIAKQLGNMPLTVVTNDVMIIRELALLDQIRLVVPGGYRHLNLLLHPESLEWVSRMNIHKFFLSTTGIHTEYGLSVFTPELAPIKRMFIETSKKVICVADHSKFDKGALFTFAALGEVETFITDHELGSSVVKRYKALNAHIQQADRSGSK